MKYLINSFIMALIDICAIIGGFIVYYFFKPSNQILIQIPAAVLFITVGFSLWTLMINRFNLNNLSLNKPTDWLLVYLMTFFWTPVIFVPVHFLTQGYLTSFGNILYTWYFQAIANLLVLFVVLTLSKKDVKVCER